MADEYRPGDRVKFQFKGGKPGTEGYGTVTRMWNGHPLIQPDVATAANLVMINIKKLEKK